MPQGRDEDGAFSAIVRTVTLAALGAAHNRQAPRSDWVGRGRGSLLLFPRPPTEPCGTVSVLHGSPVGTIRRFRITGLTPPSPAIVLHLCSFAV